MKKSSSGGTFGYKFNVIDKLSKEQMEHPGVG